MCYWVPTCSRAFVRGCDEVFGSTARLGMWIQSLKKSFSNNTGDQVLLLSNHHFSGAPNFTKLNRKASFSWFEKLEVNIPPGRINRYQLAALQVEYFEVVPLLYFREKHSNFDINFHRKEGFEGTTAREQLLKVWSWTMTTRSFEKRSVKDISHLS